MNKYFNIKKSTVLLSALFFLNAATILAEEAVLSSDLNMHVPVIRYQPATGPEQYLWADFEYIPDSANKILFSVQEYGYIDQPATPQLASLDTVTEGAPPQIKNIGSREATLVFTSTVPLACSVIYGKTRTFGQVAVDPNMNGAAIIDHRPVLAGLEPETEYFYRLQGTDAQGVIYWDEVASFKTIADDPVAATNLLALSAGARVTFVSSNFGGASNDQPWGADRAIDGSSSTAWSTAGDGDAAFIEVQMPTKQAIGSVDVWSRSMSDGSARIMSFTITIDSGEVLGPFTLPDTDKAYSFDLNRETRSMRLNVVSSSGGNTGLVEWAAYSSDGVVSESMM